jgi:hypothetical protein
MSSVTVIELHMKLKNIKKIINYLSVILSAYDDVLSRQWNSQ